MTGDISISAPTENEIEAVKKDRLALKAENDAYESEQLRSEKRRAQERMAGKAQINPPEFKKEESSKDYSKRVMTGDLNAHKEKVV